MSISPIQLFLLERQFGKHLAEAQEVGRDVTAGDDECDGHENQDDTANEAQRQRFTEHKHADDHGRNRLQRAENGGRRRTDVLDGKRHAPQRYDGREDGQRDQVAPEIPLVGRRGHDALAEIEPEQEHERTEQQAVEHEFQRRDILQRRSVRTHDIDSVRQRRGHDESHAGQTERVAVLPLVKQGYATQRQRDAKRGHPAELFPETDRHDERDHDGIDEQQGGGDAGRHVVVTLKERERRDGEQEAHDGNRQNFVALQLEIAAAQLDHQRQDGQREQITEKQDRIRVEPRPVERQCKERIEPVGGRRDGAQNITFGFGGHRRCCVVWLQCGWRLGLRGARGWLADSRGKPPWLAVVAVVSRQASRRTGGRGWRGG